MKYDFTKMAIICRICHATLLKVGYREARKRFNDMLYCDKCSDKRENKRAE